VKKRLSILSVDYGSRRAEANCSLEHMTTLTDAGKSVRTSS
jgi:hypothetical protein